MPLCFLYLERGDLGCPITVQHHESKGGTLHSVHTLHNPEFIQTFIMSMLVLMTMKKSGTNTLVYLETFTTFLYFPLNFHDLGNIILNDHFFTPSPLYISYYPLSTKAFVFQVFAKCT